MIYLKLFLVFAKIGVFGFGGGNSHASYDLSGSAVLGLMSADEFSNLVAISQVTPGPWPSMRQPMLDLTAQVMPALLLPPLVLLCLPFSLLPWHATLSANLRRARPLKVLLQVSGR